MKLIYNTNATLREMGGKNLALAATQLLLAVIAATLVVPITVGNGMSATAALFGAGVGTLIYILFTRGKSPVFLGSAHAFVGAMASAFAGGVSMSLGYLGLLIGALTQGVIMLTLAVVVKFCGSKWISRVMPPVVIGPTVALIGLELASHATHDLLSGDLSGATGDPLCSPYLALLCGLTALGVTIALTMFAKKKAIRMIPFIFGILAAYALALVLSVIGTVSGIDTLRVIDFSHFSDLLTDGRVTLASFLKLPDFTFLTAFKGGYSYGTHGSMLKYVVAIVLAYAPISFIAFAEHIADHAHISLIVDRDLLKDPGLSSTLAGDGVGSIIGALFGGCPNSSYSEAVGCMAITGNTSILSIVLASVGAILLSFFSPFVALIDSIPNCITGGICIALYGFVAVAGLSMMEGKDLEEHRNLFPIAVILITGVGELSLTFGDITVPPMACALVLGILTNLLVTRGKGKLKGEQDAFHTHHEHLAKQHEKPHDGV